MRCMDDFCVYWSNNKCTLDEISIDLQGFCESCIHLSIDEKILNIYRKETLERLDKLFARLSEFEKNAAHKTVGTKYND